MICVHLDMVVVVRICCCTFHRDIRKLQQNDWATKRTLKQKQPWNESK